MKKIVVFLLCLLLLCGGCSTAQNGGFGGFEDYKKELSAEEIKKAMQNAGKAENPTEDSVCTVTISCRTALENDDLPEATRGILPADGVILDACPVEFSKGDSAFDVLMKAVREQKIHLEYSGTKTLPYIEGVNNLYEFDCGATSGWMYRVNGWFASFGIGQYPVSGGDSIEIIYTCSLGEDIGDSYLG